MMARRLLTAPIILPLSACAGFQTSLGGEGAGSANFLRLFVLFLVVCAIMYLLVIAALAVALIRRRRAEIPLTVETGGHHQSSPLMRTALIGWAVLMVIVLTGLTIASFFTDRSDAAIARNPGLTIEVTANQWWWDVVYTSNDASKTVHTANELHLPVGMPTEVTLRASDVIHSFWVPNLAGKQDLIPGRVTDIQLLPRKIGTYRGQCAEFCGMQHAHMAFDVTVESKADFARWMAAQQQPARPPVTPLELAGYQYVTTRQCSACHNISGTPAGGQIGPDLTHFASRRSIGAGTLPMSTGNLYGWVADPQAQKIGNHMPTVGLEPNELHAIVAYLETLK